MPTLFMIYKWEQKLFLLIGVRSVALIRSRYVKEPYPTPCDLYLREGIAFKALHLDNQRQSPRSEAIIP